VTLYVHRRKDGSVASAHQEIQPGYAEEPIAEDSPELDVFKPKAPEPSRLDRLLARLVAKGVITSAEADSLK
jgi:hypothetical protein